MGRGVACACFCAMVFESGVGVVVCDLKIAIGGCDIGRIVAITRGSMLACCASLSKPFLFSFDGSSVVIPSKGGTYSLV